MILTTNPPMTGLLVSRRVFADEPFTLVDIGALGGVQNQWECFGDQLRVIAFEPNEEECHRLQAQGDPRVTWLPFGLGAKDETRTLYINRVAAGSSLVRYNKIFASRFTWAEDVETVATAEIKLRRMDDALKDVGNIDFVKLDVEGAEFDIISAGKTIFSNPDLLGLVTEIRFNKGMSGTPTFWEIEQIVRSMGYDLYDLDIGRSSRIDLPYPHDRDHRDADGKPKCGRTVNGQILDGDALYFRDLAANRPKISALKVLKLACLMEMHTHADSAAELILAYRDEIGSVADSQELLDALVPYVRGEKLSFDEYRRRYAAHDPLFRPAPGKLFPVTNAAQYEDQSTKKPEAGFFERLMRRRRD